jgi:hypothetical protein
MKSNIPKLPSDEVIKEWLATLGVNSLYDWDTLVFLYRHHASLLSAEQIARMIGQDTSAVIAAVAALESLGLVKRSRTSQGVRLYQFTAPSDPGRGGAFAQIVSISNGRAVRLFLAKQWRQRRSTHNEAPLPLHVRGRREQWLKVM